MLEEKKKKFQIDFQVKQLLLLTGNLDLKN